MALIQLLMGKASHAEVDTSCVSHDNMCLPHLMPGTAEAKAWDPLPTNSEACSPEGIYSGAILTDNSIAILPLFYILYYIFNLHTTNIGAEF